MASQLSDNLPMIVAVIVVMIVGGAAAGYVYYHNRPAGNPGLNVVQVGDNVTVNYIGLFGSGPEQGRVFDTSLYTVAFDSAAYPKSVQFSPRGPYASNFSTLDVHVGSSTPTSSGYSLGGLSFIQVVTGFWQGMIGMPGNLSKEISVPPALGYGPTDAACLSTQPLVYTVPVLQTFAGSVFAKTYPGVLATTGSGFSDPHYGWPVSILSANASWVTIQNQPTLGWSASPAGWPVVVTTINSTADGAGQITLQNQIAPSQAGLLAGKDYLGTGPCSSQSSGKFIVTSVDLANGTYTEDFNREVEGQTLIFIVTVVDIFHPVV
jgi:FKBP-type peptidyl-prolyl cis-trans isomerase 2